MPPLEFLENWLKQVQDTGGIAPVTLETAHAMHKGTRYQGSWVFSGTAAGASEQVMMILGDEHDAHLKFHAEAGGDAVFVILENPTVTSSGTQYAPRNLNRGFGIEGNEGGHVRGFVSPVLSDDGYVLTYQLLPGGVGVIAGASLDDEWVLRRGNCYVFRLYNWAVGAEVLGFRAAWVEERNNPAIDGGHPG